jgi:hypothetical protein
MRPPPGLTLPQNCATCGLQAKYHCGGPRRRAPRCCTAGGCASGSCAVGGGASGCCAAGGGASGCCAAGGGAAGCCAAGGGAAGCCAGGGAVPGGCASCAIAPELANARMAATAKPNLVMLASLQWWAAHTRARGLPRTEAWQPAQQVRMRRKQASCQHDRHDRAMNNLHLDCSFRGRLSPPDRFVRRRAFALRPAGLRANVRSWRNW